MVMENRQEVSNTFQIWYGTSFSTVVVTFYTFFFGLFCFLMFEFSHIYIYMYTHTLYYIQTRRLHCIICLCLHTLHPVLCGSRSEAYNSFALIYHVLCGDPFSC